jgi:hypothetical protein
MNLPCSDNCNRASHFLYEKKIYCRLHSPNIEQKLRLNHFMNEEILHNLVAENQENMEEAVIKQDFEEKGKYGVVRVYYNTGRVDIAMIVPEAKFGEKMSLPVEVSNEQIRLT